MDFDNPIHNDDTPTVSSSFEMEVPCSQSPAARSAGRGKSRDKGGGVANSSELNAVREAAEQTAKITNVFDELKNQKSGRIGVPELKQMLWRVNPSTVDDDAPQTFQDDAEKVLREILQATRLPESTNTGSEDEVDAAALVARLLTTSQLIIVCVGDCTDCMIGSYGRLGGTRARVTQSVTSRSSSF